LNEKGQKMKAKKSGFTLVEILIVVVILGILAAIVIPQFTEASTEARESRLCTDLQTMRSQIELYKVQHSDRLPGSETAASIIGSVGNATFLQAMTGYTDIDGDVQPGPGPNIYGPYIQKVPTNSFNDLSLVTFNAATPPATAGTDLAGWNFDPATGKFQADDDQLCSDGSGLFHSEL
jgi:general secretion pathway protein G